MPTSPGYGFARQAPREATRWLLAIAFGVWTGWLCVVTPSRAASAEPMAPPGSFAEQSRRLERANAAVVGLRAVAVEDARSAATLGRAREGSGVVIDEDGTVLTIGYLILEAEQVQLVFGGERAVPARVLAYDTATGFGLVKALVPLRLPPAVLGSPERTTTREALMIASGGPDGTVSAARLVSRRAFSGYWEYHIEGALFTSPPHPNHSGAALFNGRGELLGIGSLRVADAFGPGHPGVPGNMFVPVDLLVPILPELRAHGSSTGSQRAWLGLNCVEAEGEVRVARVSADSPADVAGVVRGDRIMRIDGTQVSTLETLWKSLWGGGAAEREVTLEVQRDGQTQTLTLQSVDRMKTLRHAPGI
jgi:S1-C subfamily serine protease